jgi:hypothetical protein
LTENAHISIYQGLVLTSTISVDGCRLMRKQVRYPYEDTNTLSECSLIHLLCTAVLSEILRRNTNEELSTLLRYSKLMSPNSWRQRRRHRMSAPWFFSPISRNLRFSRTFPSLNTSAHGLLATSYRNQAFRQDPRIVNDVLVSSYALSSFVI